MDTATQRNLTCIVCPRGCTLAVEMDGKAVRSITGNLCPRGKQYAEDECTHPRRTVTSTVKAEDGSLISVKSATTIPKESMFDFMEALRSVVVPLPIHVGDTILEDVCGTRVIATQNRERA